MLRVIPQIFQHLPRARKIGVIHRHWVIGIFRRLARRNDVRGRIDAVEPIAAHIAIRFELLILDVVSFERFSDAKAHWPRAYQRQSVRTICHEE